MDHHDAAPVQNLESGSFPKAAQYLSEMFLKTENTYHESCSALAIEVSRLITEEGGNPHLVSIRGMKVDSVNTEDLVPRRYGGKVSWGGHEVCECDGVIYDPMVGQPMPRENYLREVFESPVEIMSEYTLN